jgi:hypothetical protein
LSAGFPGNASLAAAFLARIPVPLICGNLLAAHKAASLAGERPAAGID